MYNYKEETQKIIRHCSAAECSLQADYRAPKNRSANNNKPDDYVWFCLEHVREYNKKWDYFEGMSQAEIEAFQKDAMSTGHRPTWRFHIPPHMAEEAIRQRAEEMLGYKQEGTAKPQRVPTVAEKDKTALDILGLQHPSAITAIKKQYKLLVKRYHPDVNKDDTNAEERFKDITNAYHYLVNHYVKRQC
jgi:curved DNA-binding protein CbpA